MEPTAARASEFGRVLDAASVVLSALGPGEVTTDAVAEIAEVPRSVVETYFGSDEQLATEAMWRHVAADDVTAHHGPADIVGRRQRWARPDPLDRLYLRARLAPEVNQRVRDALGADYGHEVAQQLQTLYAASLLDAGFGYQRASAGACSAGQVTARILDRGSRDDG